MNFQDTSKSLIEAVAKILLPEETEVSAAETTEEVVLKEAAKPSNGKSTVGLEVMEPAKALKDMKKFNLKGKQGRGDNENEIIVTGKNVDIFKYLKSKAYGLDVDEIEDFYPELFESVDLEEAIVYRDIRHAIELLRTTPGATKFRDSLMKKDQDAKISSSDLKKAKEMFANMSTIDSANVEKKRKDRYFPRFGVRALEEESVELEESSFDKLAKKLGRINPDTLGDVLKGKIKLNSAEQKEFDAFMKGARKMFAPAEETDLEEASDADLKKVLATAKKLGAIVKGNTADFGQGAVIDFSIEKGKIKFDGGMSSGVEYFKNVKDAISALMTGVDESIEEAVKWWTVTITKKAGKLFKGQTVDVKASNSAQAIKKGLKQMKADPMTVPSGSVDAVLGESSK